MAHYVTALDIASQFRISKQTVIKRFEKQQQGYTEDEVLDILKQYALEEHLITSSKPDVWFKQFKNK